MSEWREVTLGEIADVYDGPHATPSRLDHGPYFLNISSLNGGRLDLASSDHVSEEDFRKWTKRVEPQGDDLLFSYETRLGEAALMPHGVRACLGRRMGLLRFDELQVVPRFFLYLYLAEAFQRQITQNTIHGATVNRIPLMTMKDWTVQLPPLAEQRAIAEVLGALDDKIAANTRLAATADELASVTVSRVVSHSRMALGQVAEITMGTSPKGEDLNDRGDGTPFYQGVRDFGFRSPSLRVFTTNAIRIAEPGDVLLSVRAPVGTVNLAKFAACIGRGVASVRSTNESPYSLFHLLKGDPQIWRPFEAEGTVFSSINKKELLNIEIRTVKPEIEDEVEVKVRSLELAISSALAENQTLAETRDALLPKLMSGQLRVRDAERIAREVGA